MEPALACRPRKTSSSVAALVPKKFEKRRRKRIAPEVRPDDEPERLVVRARVGRGKGKREVGLRHCRPGGVQPVRRRGPGCDPLLVSAAPLVGECGRNAQDDQGQPSGGPEETSASKRREWSERLGHGCLPFMVRQDVSLVADSSHATG